MVVAVADGLSQAARLPWLMIIVRSCAVHPMISSVDVQRTMIDT